MARLGQCSSWSLGASLPELQSGPVIIGFAQRPRPCLVGLAASALVASTTCASHAACPNQHFRKSKRTKNVHAPSSCHDQAASLVVPIPQLHSTYRSNCPMISLLHADQHSTNADNTHTCAHTSSIQHNTRVDLSLLLGCVSRGSVQGEI